MMSERVLLAEDIALALVRYGSEAVRLYELLSAPLRHPSFWNLRGVEGVHRFILDLRPAVLENVSALDASPMEQHQFHCQLEAFLKAQESGKAKDSVGVLMRLTRMLLTARQRPLSSVANLLRLAASFLPDTACELWGKLCENFPNHPELASGLAVLPELDLQALRSPEVEITVLVNSFRRHTFSIHSLASAEEMIAAAMTPSVQANIGCRMVTQTIILPRRLVNFIAQDVVF